MCAEPSTDAAFVASFEHMPDPIVLHRGGVFVLVNQAFLALLGYERNEELVGRSIVDVVHPDDQPYVRALLATPHEQRVGNVTREHRILHRDGRALPVEVIMIPVVHKGAITPLAFVRDLSARKRLEAQLLTADRMASLGRLSASIGHEINNPLAYALGALDLAERAVHDLARRSPTEADRLAPWLATARDGVERVQRVVRNMKSLATGEAEPGGPVDIVRVLDQCAAMAQAQVTRRARLVKHYEPVPRVHGNEAALGQVFLNLLLNAADAIAEGNPQGNEVAIAARATDGEVIVEVRDTGAGVSEDVRERMFEPFFTTKSGSTGSGLGLSISHHIVTSLGGTLVFEPSTPRGSCFRVTLRATRQAVEAAPLAEETPPLGPTARVLVVDDEPLLVQVLARSLSRHHVTTASGGRQALALLREGASFDVILCDLHMDDMSGMDLHGHLHRQDPALASRMIFMTGGAATARAREFVASTQCPVLEKPFAPAALEGAVAEVLRRSGSRAAAT
jgi:PAS domain S-box-containing protein